MAAFRKQAAGGKSVATLAKENQITPATIAAADSQPRSPPPSSRGKRMALVRPGQR
jgi:hypothetical protein